MTLILCLRELINLEDTLSENLSADAWAIAQPTRRAVVLVANRLSDSSVQSGHGCDKRLDKVYTHHGQLSSNNLSLRL